MAAQDQSWNGEEYDGKGGAQHSDQQVEYDPASQSAGDIPDNGSDDDGGDYDPESVTLGTPVQIPERSTSAQAQRAPTASKPKVSGGFLVEASDDEEEEDDEEDEEDEDEEEEQEQEQTAAPAVQSDAQSQAEQQITDSQAENQPQPQPEQLAPAPAAPAMPGINPVSMFEARVNDDPRGDMDAWLGLIGAYKQQGQLDQLRATYGRFVETFPQSADMWSEWIEMELAADNFVDAEQLFGRCLMTVPSVRLWTVYLNYIRRRNDLTNDATGNARITITKSYEFVIDNIGIDHDSGHIWMEYIKFMKSAPGQVGGTGWQDKQKMDNLRKAYQRAIAVPMSTVNALWKEYDQFEMGLNKATGRKLIQERSPGYMTAKSANMALDNITRNLNRTTLPRLPPAPGFDGDVEFREQVDIWKRWIAWEKEDPLVLRDEEPKVFQQRVMYCYKQALMALRFWPEIWVEAAEWALQNEDRDTGSSMLSQGITANPESVLLALKEADHTEATFPGKEGDKDEYARAVRKPHDDVLEKLYAMGDKVKEREKLEVSTLKQAAAQDPDVQDSIEDQTNEDGTPKKSPSELQIEAIQKAYAKEYQVLSRTISYVWIALARAMRRIQGKGNATDGGLRKVFTDARQKGRLTSDVYVAVALLESIVYKDPVGAKIFERGARLFPLDENFMIEYLKFLHSRDDTTNARVVFETCVNKLIANPETLSKAKVLYQYFHKYESQYGELSQITKLEDRMAELFPEDPKLTSFAARFQTDKFDPVSAPLIISRTAQMRPRQAVPVIEQPPQAADMPAVRQPSMAPLPVQQQREQSPRQQYMRATASPKRPLGALDEDDMNPAKRFQRGPSPLKGAAGRRLDQSRRNQAAGLSRDITFVLGILPGAQTYDGPSFNVQSLVNILRDTSLPDFSTWRQHTGGKYLPTPPMPGGHNRNPSGEYGRSGSPFGRQPQQSGYRNSPLGYPNQGFAPSEGTPAFGAWPPPPPPGGFGGVPPPGGYRR